MSSDSSDDGDFTFQSWFEDVANTEAGTGDRQMQPTSSNQLRGDESQNDTDAWETLDWTDIPDNPPAWHNLKPTQTSGDERPDRRNDRRQRQAQPLSSTAYPPPATPAQHPLTTYPPAAPTQQPPTAYPPAAAPPVHHQPPAAPTAAPPVRHEPPAAPTAYPPAALAHQRPAAPTAYPPAAPAHQPPAAPTQQPPTAYPPAAAPTQPAPPTAYPPAAPTQQPPAAPTAYPPAAPAQQPPTAYPPAAPAQQPPTAYPPAAPAQQPATAYPPAAVPPVHHQPPAAPTAYPPAAQPQTATHQPQLAAHQLAQPQTATHQPQLAAHQLAEPQTATHQPQLAAHQLAQPQPQAQRAAHFQHTVAQSEPSAPATDAEQSNPQNSNSNIATALVWLIAIATGLITASIFSLGPTGMANWDAFLTTGAAAIVVGLSVSAKEWTRYPLVILPMIFATADLRWAVTLAAAVLLVLPFRLDLRGTQRKMANAALAALAVVAAFSIPSTGFLSTQGAPTLVALVATLPTVVSGFVRLRGLQRRVAIGVAGIVGTLTIVAAGLAAYVGLDARTTATAAVASANRGIDALRNSDQDKATQELQSATELFAETEETMSSALLGPARLLPVVSQNIRAVEVAAEVGQDLSVSALTTATSADLGAIRAGAGQFDLALVRTIGDELSRTAVSLEDAEVRLLSSDSPWLLSPVRTRYDIAIEDVSAVTQEVGTASRALEIMPGLLGEGGERKYLAIFTNPAEAREFGGFGSGYAIITANAGKLELTSSGKGGALNAHERIDPTSVEMIGTYPSRYLSYGTAGLVNYFGNFTGTIDFPTIAEATKELMPIKGHTEIDGVIIMDPRALAALFTLMDFTTEVEQFEGELSGENLEQFLIFDQYQLQSTAPIENLGQYLDEAEARASLLTVLSADAFDHLFTADFPSLTALTDAFAPLAAQKRLQFTTFVEAENAVLQDIGLRSSVTPVPTTTDYVQISTDTAAPNKLEPYIDRRFDYLVTVDPETGEFQGQLTITFENNAPDDLSPFVAGYPGYYFNLRPGDQRERVSLWSNQGDDDVLVDDVVNPDAESYAEYGLTRRLVFTNVLKGEARKVTMPIAGKGNPGRYELYIGSQPLADDYEFTVTVSAAPGWIETSQQRRTFSTTFPLEQDVVLALEFARE